jgi:hypothetical protein
LPRFEPLRFPERAEVDERGQSWMMHFLQLVAPTRPACLLGCAAADANLQHYTCASRQIDRTSVACDAEAVGDDPDNLHGSPPTFTAVLVLRTAGLRGECSAVGARTSPARIVRGNGGWRPGQRRNFG